MDDGFEDSIRKIEEKFGRVLKSSRSTGAESKKTLDKKLEQIAQQSTDIADEYYYGREAGRVFEKDLNQAQAFYHVGAMAGNPYAQYSYGFMLIHDLETKDYTEAVSWLEKAANQGDTNAMSELGVLYYYGRGVQKNYETSNSWYEKGAEANDPKCLLYLGMNYLYGHGKGVDPQKALELFTKAKENLGNDSSGLEEIERNIERAKRKGALNDF